VVEIYKLVRVRFKETKDLVVCRPDQFDPSIHEEIPADEEAPQEGSEEQDSGDGASSIADLNSSQAIDMIASCSDVASLDKLQADEEAGKARKGVLNEIRKRREALTQS